MDKTQKGAANWLALIFLAVIVIALVGIGWVWHRGSDTVAVADVPNTGTDSGYTYSIASSTASSTVTTTATEPTTQTRTVTTYVKKTVAAPAAAFTGVSGSTYHNGTYGLTLRLPTAGWTTYMTAGGPAGLPGTAQIHFVAPGESQDAFVVNVWDKQGWNIVRTNENFVHQNTSNIGEGTYLGENFTWIYSDTVYSHAAEAQAALSRAVFY